MQRLVVMTDKLNGAVNNMKHPIIAELAYDGTMSSKKNALSAFNGCGTPAVVIRTDNSEANRQYQINVSAEHNTEVMRSFCA